MNRLKSYYELTLQLIELSESISSSDDREDGIQTIEALLDKREELLKEATPPFSPEEMQTGKELIEMEKTLRVQLEKVKNSIKKDIIGLQAKKQGNQKYSNPYENLTTDGVFYDKRK
ncbi:flagellar protein FliT [Peribacillus tepidiphilus]|uniref:flagellar protein FliT n=1 Tax=Peribacillus tepidiphilus TaxID=2652445 RepID=UPI0035B558A8